MKTLLSFFVSFSILTSIIFCSTPCYAKNLTVDKHDPLAFNSIQDAIDKAKRGDTVFIKNGTYKETLKITKAISLTGQDTDKTIITNPDKPEADAIIPIIKVEVEDIKKVNISRLTIKWQEFREKSLCILSTKSNIEIRDNIIEGAYWNVVINGGKPTIQNNQILNGSNGIEISQARAYVDNNSIYNNRGKGLFISGPGWKTSASNNIIYLNKYGVYADSGSHVTLTDNTILANSEIGIWVIEKDTEATIKNNTIQFNKKFGIGVSHNGKAKILENNISYSGYDGIQLYKAGDGENQIINNTISYNKDDGIQLRTDSQALIYNNIIYSNGGDGIRITQSSPEEPIRENIIAVNRYSAVDIEDKSTVTLQHNIFVGNLNNIYVEGKGDNGIIKENYIFSARKNGILFSEYSSGQCINNIIAYNNTGITSKKAEEIEVKGNRYWKNITKNLEGGVEDLNPSFEDIDFENPESEQFEKENVEFSKSSKWFTIQGRMKELREDYTSALQFYEKAFAKDSLLKEALLLKGNVYKRQKKYSQANKAYKAIPLDNIISLSAYRKLLEINKLQKKNLLERLKGLSDHERKIIEKKDSSIKEKAYIRIIRSYISDEYYDVADLLMRQDKFEEAEVVLKNMHDAHLDTPESMKLLVKNKTIRDQNKEALRIAEGMIKENIPDEDLLFYAAFNAAFVDIPKAETYLEMLLQKKSDYSSFPIHMTYTQEAVWQGLNAFVKIKNLTEEGEKAKDESTTRDAWEKFSAASHVYYLLKKYNYKETISISSPKLYQEIDKQIKIIKQEIDPLRENLLNEIKIAVIPYHDTFDHAHLFFKKFRELTNFSIVEDHKFKDIYLKSNNLKEYDIVMSPHFTDKIAAIYTYQPITNTTWKKRINVNSSQISVSLDRLLDLIINLRTNQRIVAKTRCEKFDFKKKVEVVKNYTLGRKKMFIDNVLNNFSDSFNYCLSLFPEDKKFKDSLNEIQEFSKEVNAQYLERRREEKEEVENNQTFKRIKFLYSFEKERKPELQKNFEAAKELLKEDYWTAKEKFENLLYQIHPKLIEFKDKDKIKQDLERAIRVFNYEETKTMSYSQAEDFVDSIFQKQLPLFLEKAKKAADYLENLESQIKPLLFECSTLIFSNLQVSINGDKEIIIHLEKKLEELGITKINKAASVLEDKSYDMADLHLEVISPSNLFIRVKDFRTGEFFVRPFSIDSVADQLKKILNYVITKRNQLFTTAYSWVRKNESKEEYLMAYPYAKLKAIINPNSWQIHFDIAKLEGYLIGLSWTKDKKQVLLLLDRILENQIYTNPKWISQQKQLSETGFEKHSVIIEKGKNYGNMGYTMKAKFFYEEALKLSPDNYIILHSLGSVFHSIGNYNEAFKLFQKAKKNAIKGNISYDNMDINYSFNLISYYTTLKEMDNALMYARTLADTNKSAWGYDVLGNTYFNMSDFDNAEKVLKEAIKKDPFYHIAYYSLAKIYFHKGNYKFALDNIIKALKYTRNPVDIGDYSVQLYLIYQEMGEAKKAKKALSVLGEALSHYEEAFKDNPSSFLLAYAIGITNIELQQYKKADDWLKKAEELAYTEHLKSNPLKQRAWIAMLKGDYDNAEKLYKESIKADVVEAAIEEFSVKDEAMINPLESNSEIKYVTLNLNYGALYELAWLYDLQGRTEESKELIKKTLKMDKYNQYMLYAYCGSKDTSCSYFKALIYEAKGEKDKAIKQWKKYLRKIPTGWFSDNARKHLDNLEKESK